jgi:hypothetical protein
MEDTYNQFKSEAKEKGIMSLADLKDLYNKYFPTHKQESRTLTAV